MRPGATGHADLSVLDDVGGCFEAVGESLALVRSTLREHAGNSRVLERSLPLVCEAQARLRAACRRLGARRPRSTRGIRVAQGDSGPTSHLYQTLHATDESADPAGWYDLLIRIESMAPGGRTGRLASSQVEQVRDRLKRLQDVEVNENDWTALFHAVDDIVTGGVPPSSRELRELLLPLIDELPDRDQLPAGFRLVLREIDRFLATRSAAPMAAAAHEPSADLKEAASLVRGKSIVLIGGNRRREAQESLRIALGLKDLVWIETKEHQAVDTFEPLIARPDVAVVMLAIRWSSHAFADVRAICERHGKPLVRLPGGYSPNQVAAQVLAQCSDQLSSEQGQTGPRAGPASRSGSGFSPG